MNFIETLRSLLLYQLLRPRVLWLGYVYKSCPQRRQIHGRGNLPLFEVSIEDSAGEPFPADPDALQDAITAQLMHDQVVVHHTWGKCRVGDIGGFSLS